MSSMVSMELMDDGREPRGLVPGKKLLERHLHERERFTGDLGYHGRSRCPVKRLGAGAL